MRAGIDRRNLVLGGLAAPLFGAASARAGPEGEPVYIGDMHFHLFFVGPNRASARPLRTLMDDGRATLVSWSLVADMPWIRASAGRFTQKSSPRPGEAAAWLGEELGRMTAHAAAEGVKIAKTTDDVARALKGEPHVVLSAEGASFADGDIGQFAVAYEAGVRHVQLVHFIDNTIGDFQTAAPRAGGLTDFGKQAVAECNRLGILIDLAHCTEEAVAQALGISKAPVVWSHSSVTGGVRPAWTMTPWRARQISVETAQAIAKKGGVVGLWGLRADIGDSVEAYAERLMELAGLLGDDHAAFGTDMNAVSRPVIRGYADLQKAIARWQRRGHAKAKIEKLAIGNYARVLTAAMTGRMV